MTLDLVRSILGWCTVINTGLLLFWFLFYVLAHKQIKHWHTTIFPLSGKQFNVIHYKGIVYYKLGIILFNFVPYLAIVIVSCDNVG